MMETKKFIQEPWNDIKEGKKAYILIEANIYPPSPYKYVMSGKSVDWEKLGFVVIEEKGVKRLKRDGRIYYSPVMEEIEDWCKQHKLKFDFYPPKNESIGTVFLGSSTLMIVTGKIKPEIFDKTPWDNLVAHIVVE